MTTLELIRKERTLSVEAIDKLIKAKKVLDEVAQKMGFKNLAAYQREYDALCGTTEKVAKEKRKRATLTKEMRKKIITALKSKDAIIKDVAQKLKVSVSTVNKIKAEAKLTKPRQKG